MNRLLTILLLLGATAHGQINNPPTSVNIVDSTATGRAVLTATNAAAAASAIGLGGSDNVFFGSVEVGEGDSLYLYGSGVNSLGFGGELNFEERRLSQDGSPIFDWGSSFSVTPPATFATNVTVNGNLSVGSLTTTTPSTWALDATQTAAATNGILALPSNANVIRLTNNNAISGVSGGVLGAFYYLVNQTTNAVTISNVGGITVQGGTPLTLGANQAATLVATGATNASVAARGDLNDVALGGTANTAPSQTASSGASLMTRDLVYPAHTDDGSGDLVFPGGFVSSGTGALASAYLTAGNLAQITTNTNTMAGAYFGDSIWTHRDFSGASIPSDKVLDVALKGVVLRMETNQNYVLRVVVGAGTATRTPPPAGSDALTARGWGVNFFYNGTNYVYQPFWYATNYNTGPAVALTNMSTAFSQWTASVFTMRLRQETNGDIKFWINNGLNSRLGSTPSFQTNVVWGASTFGGRSIAIEAAAATNAAPVSSVRIHNRVGYLKYEQ